jgi:hypothetical protein
MMRPAETRELASRGLRTRFAMSGGRVLCEIVQEGGSRRVWATGEGEDNFEAFDAAFRNLQQPPKHQETAR